MSLANIPLIMPDPEFDAPAAKCGPATLADEVGHEALRYRQEFEQTGEPLYRLCADTLDRLAAKVRFAGTDTVAEYEARIELFAQWERER